MLTYLCQQITNYRKLISDLHKKIFFVKVKILKKMSIADGF